MGVPSASCVPSLVPAARRLPSALNARHQKLDSGLEGVKWSSSRPVSPSQIFTASLDTPASRFPLSANATPANPISCLIESSSAPVSAFQTLTTAEASFSRSSRDPQLAKRVPSGLNVTQL